MPDPRIHADGPQGNRFDTAARGVYEQREQDWRNGAVVYQVLVDRFVPSAHLHAKRALYPAPKVLRRWDEAPKRGVYLEAERLWSHEIEFWGGDLKSLAGRLDHVQQLGARAEYWFCPPPTNGADAAAAVDDPLDAFMHLWALNRGVLMTPFHNMALLSPVHTETDVDRHTEVFSAALAALTR